MTVESNKSAISSCSSPVHPPPVPISVTTTSALLSPTSAAAISPSSHPNPTDATSSISQSSSAAASSSRMVQCFTGSTTDQNRRGAGGGTAPYYRRLEKVKFGVPVSEAFSNDIPATLLVLLLKVNKQGPLKKDIWRAPGNQAHVRKLIHVMQHGRLVNIENFSAYTAASVVKKFLTKIPGGIFGKENEERLFQILSLDDHDKQREAFCRVVSSLPVPSQHLVVLLVGTFRLIADAAESCGLKTSPDAIGVSVAPSLFHSCILNGHRAKMEDIARFHMASKVISLLVQGFGYPNLFPRENYEFYARITGRTLRVDENWRFTFQYPSNLVFGAEGIVGPNGDVVCCSASSSMAVHQHNQQQIEEDSSSRAEAAKNWLMKGSFFVQHSPMVGAGAGGPGPNGGSGVAGCCLSLNINRSRSSPARVNPYLGICGELGGSWTELISLQHYNIPQAPQQQQQASAAGLLPLDSTTNNTSKSVMEAGCSSEDNLGEMKASSCEF